ncbi:hypothetical protein [Arthrobacter sp. StoSoilB5]|uniref:hypothetical protein n=1 Tax=Arthrobacter sp. StoSoilB5 TaxID=2830992 RepID=UPI001CC4CEA7|nr:hypothetical protein [Arthrobacter sp. StoSoilB5]BCW44948.1 hypothetical protein StoSoilB5_21320 [Arthrobacter sp. StoSoilB5]
MHHTTSNSVNSPGETITDGLTALDGLFADFLRWIPRLFDPERGGFYYALSSTNQPEFEADIESTCAAMAAIDELGLLPSVTDSVRARIVNFLQERQDPESGYFFDRQNEMREVERLRGRALNVSLKTLSMLGASPLHNLPGQDKEDQTLEHLWSEAAFAAWLDARPWHNSWLAQDNIQAQTSLIRLLPQAQQEARVAQAIAYVRSRQDTATGHAGGGTPYVVLSGSFKLALFCRDFGRPVPLAQQIYASTLECIREEDCLDACWLRNPIELVEVLAPQIGGIPPSELADIVRISAVNASAFLEPDGGFSRKIGQSSASPNEIRLGLGAAEGDWNASTQLAARVRPALYRLAGQKQPALPWSNDFGQALHAAASGR